MLRENQKGDESMRKTLMTAAIAALIAIPTLASADDRAAAGAATGAAVGGVTGAIVGGPVGAAVGAGIGGTVGAGTAADQRRDVIIEHRNAPVTERNCVRDSMGQTVCREIRR
jgi:outer membrane lipoprotein SlyB